VPPAAAGPLAGSLSSLLPAHKLWLLTSSSIYPPCLKLVVLSALLAFLGDPPSLGFSSPALSSWSQVMLQGVLSFYQQHQNISSPVSSLTLETSFNHQGRYFPEMSLQTLLWDESKMERLRNEDGISRE